MLTYLGQEGVFRAACMNTFRRKIVLWLKKIERRLIENEVLIRRAKR